MKILIYSPVKILPANEGSAKRIFNFITKLISQGHELHLVCLTVSGLKREVHDELLEYFKTVTVLKQPKGYSKLFGKNIEIDEGYIDGMGEKVRDLCRLFRIDTIICNYIFQSKMLEYLPETVVKVIDTHDKFTDKYKLNKWFSYDEANEAKGLKRADIVVAIQQNEEEYFREISGRETITINHFDDKKELNRDYDSIKKIGFLSSGHKQDLISAKEFIELFIDMHDRGLIKTELLIAGKICDLLDFEHPAVKYLGLVDSLDDFYKELDICLVLPLTGTGLKIKTAEALAYGVPVISTRCGFEGIFTDRPYHTADTMPELMDYLRAACDDGDLKEMASDSVRLFDRYLEQLDEAFDKMMRLIEEKQQPMTDEVPYELVFDIYNKSELGGEVAHTERVVERPDKELVRKLKKISSVSVAKNPIEKYRRYKDLMDYYESEIE